MLLLLPILSWLVSWSGDEFCEFGCWSFWRMKKEICEMSRIWHLYSSSLSLRCSKSSFKECPTTTLSFKIFLSYLTKMKIRFVRKDRNQFTYNWCDFRVGWSMLQIIRLDSSNPLPVILNFCPRLDQRVKHNVAVKVDDWNSSESVTFLRQDALAVQCENLCLSKKWRR